MNSWKSDKDGNHFQPKPKMSSGQVDCSDSSCRTKPKTHLVGVKHEDSTNKKVTMKEFIKSGNYLEDEVRRRAQKGSPHFFDEDSMRFFSSRVSELMWQKGDRKNYQTNPIYFITSEADRNSQYHHRGSVRAFTVRVIDKDGDIKKIGDFQGHATLNDARREIKEIITG